MPLPAPVSINDTVRYVRPDGLELEARVISIPYDDMVVDLEIISSGETVCDVQPSTGPVPGCWYRADRE